MKVLINCIDRTNSRFCQKYSWLREKKVLFSNIAWKVIIMSESIADNYVKAMIRVSTFPMMCREKAVGASLSWWKRNLSLSVKWTWVLELRTASDARQQKDSLLSFIGSSRYRAGISEVSCMRESGFTEIRWYHGQIVRPKLIFSYWLGAFLMLRKYLYSKK